jgi:putative hemolysin
MSSLALVLRTGSGPEPVLGELLAFAGSLACLGLASFGSLAATSLLLYSPSKLQLRRNGGGEALVEEMEQRDGEYQIVARTLHVGGLVLAFLVLQLWTDAPAWVMALFAVVALFFCSVLPPAVAEKRAEATLLPCLPLLRCCRWLLLLPVIRPLAALTRLTLRLLRVRDEPSGTPEEIAEEVMAAVSDSVEDDALQEEKRWIGNILELKELKVSEAMTPRTDIVGIPAAATAGEAVQLALKHGFSRYPVFEGRIDEIVGLFYVKDALRLLDTDGHGQVKDLQTPVRAMMREPLFVPETMAVVQLLRRLKADRLQMAIVLDEYGGTAGLISIEDILEEIVGDIDDEYDAQEQEDEARVLEIEKGRVVEIPARTRVADVNAMLGTELVEGDDYDTIAGYVISQLNRIPATGETVRLDGVEIRILKADDRRLRRLRVTALQPEPAPEER